MERLHVRVAGAALWLAVVTAATQRPQAQELASVLGFEGSQEDAMPRGWGGGPASTIHLDETVVHSGRQSVRLERDATSEGEFTAITMGLPAEMQGQRLQLLGWLRTEDVVGYAGLWLREDTPDGVVEFDNMSDRPVVGTTDWTRYRVDLPLDARADHVTFGALFSGTGRVWVDDLQLRVDGRPIWRAPPARRPVVTDDRGHEFDAGSGLEALTPSDVQIQNLALLGKVWGFIKYHHPRLAQGELHWDDELFRALPAVLAATDGQQRDAAMEAMLARAGEPEPCAPCAREPQDVHLRPDLAWLDDHQAMGVALGQRLAEVYQRRHASSVSHQVAMARGVGNPIFAHERTYPANGVPDAGYRLLALFRFWNIIEYWFPYRDQIEGDWEDTLTEFIPRLLAATDEHDYALEMMALIARVGDTHANLWSSMEHQPPQGEAHLPVALRWVEGRVVVSGWLQPDAELRTGLRRGDLILALDGEPLDALFERWAPYYGASNLAARRRDQVQHLTRGPKGPARLEVERAGQRVELQVERVPVSGAERFGPATWHDRPETGVQRLSDDVAYLSLRSVRAADAASYVKAAEGARGLVIDIRNYPSEFMVFALGSHLVDDVTPFVRFTEGDPANPGAFVWTEPLNLTPQAPRYEGRVAILVDETSQSQAEYTALAFRAAPQSAVIGSTTSGADGNVSEIPLPGGLRTMISGIGVFHPDRRPTQRVGIVPDIEVHPTIAGITDGRDEVLEAALRWILGPEADDATLHEMARHP